MTSAMGKPNKTRTTTAVVKLSGKCSAGTIVAATCMTSQPTTAPMTATAPRQHEPTPSPVSATASTITVTHARSRVNARASDPPRASAAATPSTAYGKRAAGRARDASGELTGTVSSRAGPDLTPGHPQTPNGGLLCRPPFSGWS